MYVSEVRKPRRPLWLWPNLLSLDAPVLSILWLWLFAETLHVQLEPAVGVALSITVWLIYAGDRLLDGWKPGGGESNTARHRFHRVHRRALAAAMSMGAALGVWACLCLDPVTFRAGLALSLAVAAYFSAIHLLGLRVPKEGLVALLFSVGTFFPVWIHGSGANAIATVLLVLFMAVCWLNVVLIEHSEWVWFGRNRSDMPHRTTLSAGPHLAWIAGAVGVMACSLSLFVGLRPVTPALVAIALSAAGLCALSVYRRQLSIEAVRVLADVALLTPLFVLPYLIR